MNCATQPLPGLLDDPQLHDANLPAFLGFQIAPLRDPVPARHGADIPAPLEPLTDSSILHVPSNRANLTSRHPSNSQPTTSSQVTHLPPKTSASGSIDNHDNPSDKKRPTPPISPNDLLLARESKKPYMAISELLRDKAGTDVIPAQLPSFISLAVVERSPVQRHSSIQTPSFTELAPSQKRPRLDADSEFGPHGSARHLPLPERRDDRITRPAPLLPTMLTGLHEPPPSAALLPSMEVDSRATVLRGTSSRIEVRDILADQSTDSPAPSPTTRRVSSDESGPPIRQLQETFITSIQTSRNNINTEQPTAPAKSKKVRRARKKWSEQETNDLMAGLKKYGAGKWKQILDDPAFKFYERSSVDLKDRYRVCSKEGGVLGHRSDREARGSIASTATDGSSSPAEVLEASSAVTSSQTKASSHPSITNTTRRPSTEDTTTITDVTLPPKHSQEAPSRRKRRAWTPAEDEALLRGVIRHGFQWTAIHSDPDLNLDHRRATDLRDRIRNKFPDGYKHAESAPSRSEQRKAEKSGPCGESGSSTPRESLSSIQSEPSRSWVGIVANKDNTPIAGAEGMTNSIISGSITRGATTGEPPKPVITLGVSASGTTAESSGLVTTAGTDSEKDQTGVTLPGLTQYDDNMDWGDNRLPPLLEWEDIGM